jgi:hypothetical protein
MVERRGRRIANGLSQRAFTLEPARPPLFRAMVRTLVCALCAVAGAAGISAWHAQRGDMPAAQCIPASVDENQLQTELARTRLALAAESAARVAVQATADSAAAEVARLTTELRFLRGQSGSRSAAPGASSRR